MAKIINLPTMNDERGSLSIIEKVADFDIKRVYYIYNTDGKQRGGHRHKTTKQVLVCVNGSCDVPESNRNYNFQDCFNNPNHTGHGPQTTSANGDLSLTNITYQYVCGSAADKCVEIKLKVTDKRYNPNKSSQTVVRHFKVNP